MVLLNFLCYFDLHRKFFPCFVTSALQVNGGETAASCRSCTFTYSYRSVTC